MHSTIARHARLIAWLLLCALSSSQRLVKFHELLGINRFTSFAISSPVIMHCPMLWQLDTLHDVLTRISHLFSETYSIKLQPGLLEAWFKRTLSMNGWLRSTLRSVDDVNVPLQLSKKLIKCYWFIPSLPLLDLTGVYESYRCVMQGFWGYPD